jgi:hypothetical protein
MFSAEVVWGCDSTGLQTPGSLMDVTVICQDARKHLSLLENESPPMSQPTVLIAHSSRQRKREREREREREEREREISF